MEKAVELTLAVTGFVMYDVHQGKPSPEQITRPGWGGLICFGGMLGAWVVFLAATALLRA